MVAGFGVYGLYSGQANFFVQYKYTIGDTFTNEYEIEVMSVDVDPKTHIYPLMFEAGLVEV